MHVRKQSARLKDVLQPGRLLAWTTYHISLHVPYSLQDDEHKMFETCRRQEELN